MELWMYKVVNVMINLGTLGLEVFQRGVAQRCQLDKPLMLGVVKAAHLTLQILELHQESVTLLTYTRTGPLRASLGPEENMLTHGAPCRLPHP